MGELTRLIVENFSRKLEPSTVLDIGFTDSDYIGFLFSYVGNVNGIDFRYVDRQNPRLNFLQAAYKGNYRYTAVNAFRADMIICTDYLEKCGIFYRSDPLTPLEEQIMLFDGMVETASKGVVVTVPFCGMSDQEECVRDGRFIHHRQSLRRLLDYPVHSGYNVEVTYYKDDDIVSPQRAAELEYPDVATCAIEVIKRRF